MEIRTLRAGEREALLHLLDGWELPDGWRGRDFFRRYVERDPSYRDENVWVAAEDGQLLACVQIFPRVLRLHGHEVPTGGIGSVFTAAARREQGIAGAVLERVGDAMAERGMELSLLFSGRTDFYARHGWQSFPVERAIARPAEPERAAPAVDAGVAVADFAPEADLEEVRAVHDAYGAGRDGTVVRDDGLWRASLELAGNPWEEFRVARRDGQLVAYLRTTLLYGSLLATELGRRPERPDGAEALAGLVADALGARDPDPLARPERASDALRAFLVLPAFDDLQLTVALEQRGVGCQPTSDPTPMLRCLAPAALARRLDVEERPGEPPVELLRRLLPPERLAFWPADRF